MLRPQPEVAASFGTPFEIPARRAITLHPQDTGRLGAGFRLIGSVLSGMVIVAALCELRGMDLPMALAMVPRSPFFWAVFAASYLTAPFVDWLIYRHLWCVRLPAFGALIRKLIYNELLLSYVGDAYFYTWARRNARLEGSPFGAVKDVAILSAAAGNLVTLLMLAIAWPLASASQLALRTHSLLLSLLFVLAISCATILLRRQIFSLPRQQLSYIFVMHIGRIVAGAGLLMLMWHLALPNVPLAWWLLLTTIRLLVARLPLVPNHDIMFAGIAVFELGNDGPIASILSLVAILILLTHLLGGCVFVIVELWQEKEVAPGRRLAFSRFLPLG